MLAIGYIRILSIGLEPTRKGGYCGGIFSNANTLIHSPTLVSIASQFQFNTENTNNNYYGLPHAHYFHK